MGRKRKPSKKLGDWTERLGFLKELIALTELLWELFFQQNHSKTVNL